MADDRSLAEFADAVAAANPAPAGGAVAAASAALAASLAGMVGRVAQARPGAGDRASLADLVESADRARMRLLELAEEDGQAFLAVVAARRNRQGTDAERAERVGAAWRGATLVPAEVLRLCGEVAELAHRAAREGPPSTIGDAVMAALLAAAAGGGSELNVRLNLQAAGVPEDLRALADQSETALRETQRAAADTRRVAEERLTGKKSEE